MDAKRMIPVVQILDGRVVDPVTGAEAGSPSTWARKLEMGGADEILFRGLDGDHGWVAEVARSLFIPFAVEVPFQDEAELALILAQGADRVVVPAGRELDELLSLGRARLIASLEARWSPGDGWGPALEILAGLGQTWAGQALVSPGTTALGELSAQAETLPMPLLLACSDPLLAALALAQGAEGIVFPAGLMGAAEFKALLSPGGTPFRV